MTEIGIREAKARWVQLLRRVAAGEEIVICRRRKPVAHLVPVRRGESRRLGIDQGVFEVPDDFDAPLPDDVVAGFEGPTRPAPRRS